MAIRCPKCGEKEKINGRSLQYCILRECMTCGQTWSGSTMVAQIDESLPPPLPGVPEPEDEMVLPVFTGAPFRREDRNFGDEDE